MPYNAEEAFCNAFRYGANFSSAKNLHKNNSGRAITYYEATAGILCWALVGARILCTECSLRDTARKSETAPQPSVAASVAAILH